MYHKYKWTHASLNRNELLREYEPIQPFFFLSLLDLVGVDTFFDIGANIGAYSLFASSLDRIAVVHSFEPNPPTFQELKDNIALNQLSRTVMPYNVAVSAREGELEFGVVSELSGANGVLSTSIHDPEKFQNRITVNCVPLDSLDCRMGDCIALKIDVEGHELDVLAGAEKLLKRNLILQIEDYKMDSALSGFLADFKLERVAQIGPDSYYMKSANAITGKDVVHLFERAAQCMIDSNHSGVSADARRGNSAKKKRATKIRQRIVPGVVMEFDGVVADSLRAGKRLFSR